MLGHGLPHHDDASCYQLYHGSSIFEVVVLSYHVVQDCSKDLGNITGVYMTLLQSVDEGDPSTVLYPNTTVTSNHQFSIV
jgi:hypothetical protein